MGEWIVGVGALGLLTVTFLPWYQIAGTYYTAWDELKPGRYALVATAVVGLLLLVVAGAGRSAQTRVLMAARTAVAGFACLVYVAYRLLDRPDGFDADFGIFLGLVSALLLTIGGVVSARSQADV